MQSPPASKSFLTTSILALAFLAAAPGCDDGETVGRPQTDYDTVEDVDPEEYADGEESPTVMEASSRWNASRGIDANNYRAGEVRPATDCFMHLDTGHIAWDSQGAADTQLSIGKAAVACGPMRLTVGYVDHLGRNRSTSEDMENSGGWWQNEYSINLDLQDGRRYPQYVQLCSALPPQWPQPTPCYTMYRPW